MKKFCNVSSWAFAAFLIIVCMGASCEQSGTSESADYRNVLRDDFVVAFYNVENLFDTLDSRWTNDEEFTPNGKLNWTTDKYNTKLKHIAEVMDSLPGELPVFMALCEIENRSVLEDLLKQPLLAKASYKIVHKDSPDERGIDVAMLCDTAKADVEFFNFTTINLPDASDPYTRDVLYVRAKVNGETMHLYANHWPSRGGGQVETEPLRIAVANVVEMQIGNILKADKNANIIVMGDFNDTPTDKSIAQVLNAGVEKNNVLYNHMCDDAARNEGSHYYKGEWSALDQIMTSRALHEGKGKFFADDDAAKYFKNDLVLFNSKDGKRPNRTYVGEEYKGGYSDHLPVYITVKIKE